MARRDETLRWVWCPSCGYHRRPSQVTHVIGADGSVRPVCEVCRPGTPWVLPAPGVPQIVGEKHPVVVTAAEAMAYHAPETYRSRPAGTAAREFPDSEEEAPQALDPVVRRRSLWLDRACVVLALLLALCMAVCAWKNLWRNP